MQIGWALEQTDDSVLQVFVDKDQVECMLSVDPNGEEVYVASLPKEAINTDEHEIKVVNTCQKNQLLLRSISLSVTVPSRVADSSRALKKLRTATIDGPVNTSELESSKVHEGESIFDNKQKETVPSNIDS